ncbi:hypothetical protein [Streptomyces canus]|uniref:hypothetical protein n=1 Tax=Streptomyces canus TaxID=58343 RepID=UPI002E2C34EF|nr:hypothetical protein [Streptomyces canus]
MAAKFLIKIVSIIVLSIGLFLSGGVVVAPDTAYAAPPTVAMPTPSPAPPQQEGAAAGSCSEHPATATSSQNDATPSTKKLLIVVGYLFFVLVMSALAGIVVGWLTRKAGGPTGNAWAATLAGVGAAVVFAGFLTNALPPILKFLGIGF